MPRTVAQHMLCQHQPFAVLLLLGSNCDGKNRLKHACALLKKFGVMQPLQLCHGADYSGKSHLPYDNLALVLTLVQPLNVTQLNHVLKQIEQDCGRDENKNCADFGYQVAMDIDLLALQLHEGDDFLMLAERYPFKAHEWQCIGDFLPFHRA